VADARASHISGQHRAGLDRGHPAAAPPNGPHLRTQPSLTGVIALVDAVALRRECTLALLRSHLRAPFRTFPSVSDLLRDDAADAGTPACVLLWTGALSVTGEPWRGELLRLRSMIPAVPVIILSDRAQLEDVIAAFRQGARGYILTSQEPRLAVDALRMVLAGSTYFPADVLLGRRADPAPAAPPPPPPIMAADAMPADRLAPKQLEVLRAIAEGCTNKDISRQLMMEEATVKMHVRRIMRRLGVANRTQAALLARRYGLCTTSGSGD
jgi:DNA-binding NarL/FixJ family response regulator